MLKTQCLLCESNAHTKVKFAQNFSEAELSADTFSARRTTEHFHYQLLECRTCGLVFSSPILPLEKIAGLYRKSKQNYDKETGLIAGSYIRYIRENDSLSRNKGRALDIGCGSGFFLKELQHAGYAEVSGVEPSEEAVAKSGDLRAHIFNGFFEKAVFPENSFDLITCFQTLDHLIDPLGVLKKILQLLKPGGMAYLIMHNEKSLQARLFGEKSPIYDVEHIYLFNKRTLPLVCQKAGFETLKVFDVKNVYPLAYWLRMAPIPMKSLALNICDTLGLSGIRVGIYPGNMGIFIRKASI